MDPECHTLSRCCCCCRCVCGLFLLLQEVRAVSELLPAPEGCMDGCFIGLGWLDNWVNSMDSPGPLDNTVLWCEHSRLNPSLPAGTTKYISDAAWQQLTVRQRLAVAGAAVLQGSCAASQQLLLAGPTALCSAGQGPLTHLKTKMPIRGNIFSMHCWATLKTCCTT